MTAPVRRRERVRIVNRRFQQARSGFGMKALDRHIHVVAQLEQRLMKIRLDG